MLSFKCGVEFERTKIFSFGANKSENTIGDLTFVLLFSLILNNNFTARKLNFEENYFSEKKEKSFLVEEKGDTQLKRGSFS